MVSYLKLVLVLSSDESLGLDRVVHVLDGLVDRSELDAQLGRRLLAREHLRLLVGLLGRTVLTLGEIERGVRLEKGAGEVLLAEGSGRGDESLAAGGRGDESFGVGVGDWKGRRGKGRRESVMAKGGHSKLRRRSELTLSNVDKVSERSGQLLGLDLALSNREEDTDRRVDLRSVRDLVHDRLRRRATGGRGEQGRQRLTRPGTKASEERRDGWTYSEHVRGADGRERERRLLVSEELPGSTLGERLGSEGGREQRKRDAESVNRSSSQVMSPQVCLCAYPM